MALEGERKEDLSTIIKVMLRLLVLGQVAATAATGKVLYIILSIRL